MKKLYIQTYGCQMNQHDSERIVRLMRELDYVPTERLEEADLVILNTCTVRDKAEQKVYSALGRWAELKKRKNEVILGVAGCLAQQEGANLLRRVPHLDLVFGPHNIYRLPQMIREVESFGRRPVEVAFYRDPFYMEDYDAQPIVQGPKAFVTIMEGCSKVCSFCVVPYVRGREVSRPSERIIREVRSLVQQGVKEVMLLGQNVNSYGKASPGEMSFPELLKEVNEIDGLERIRFTTSHPQDLSPELVEAYATLEKLCEHLHLPVQSGADSVLERMKRGYTRDEYLTRIRHLHERRPEVALSTDVIVGFPGETEEEFQRTLEILEEVAYDEIFAFTYSARPQTASAKIYADDVAEDVKRERLSRVQSLQSEISLRKNSEKIGRTEEILVEGPAKLNDQQIMGRTRNNRIVNAEAPDDLLGKMIQVRITGASAISLVGELLTGSQYCETLERRGIA